LRFSFAWPASRSCGSPSQVDLVKEPKEAFENVPEAAGGDNKEPPRTNIRLIDKTRSKEQVGAAFFGLASAPNRLRTSLLRSSFVCAMCPQISKDYRAWRRQFLQGFPETIVTPLHPCSSVCVASN
jgi:hypothetical protein